ncbi:MAG: hypothetical protein KA158_04200 [Leucobacter sp.]|nr:hypothetical protein [Leucobacter sp.]
MQAIYAATIIVVFIALGELISKTTRARVPTLFIAMIGMLIASSMGLIPTDIVAASGFAAFGAMILPSVMVHLGTMIPLSELKRQYKAILVAAGSLLVAALLIIGVATALFDFPTAVAGAAPMLGGLVSALVTVDGLTTAGYSSIVALPVIVMLFATLPGMPLTAFLLRRHARWLVSDEHAEVTAGQAGAASTTRAPKLKLPKWFMENNFLIISVLMVLGAGAYFVGNLTGISYTIWGLGVGFIATWLGVLPQRAMQQANGFSLAMIAIIAVVVAPILGTSLEALLSMMLVVVTIIVVGLVGLVVGGLIMSKLVKWRPAFAISVALTAVYGFPADFLITNEVAETVGKTPAQRQQLLDAMLPQMLIGGFTSVSAGSVVIASILVGTL